MARVNARTSVFWVATLMVGLLVGTTLVGGVSAKPAGPPGGLEVAEQNLDQDGNIKVHEQGLAQVTVAPVTHGEYANLTIEGQTSANITLDPVLNASTIVIDSTDPIIVSFFGPEGRISELGDRIEPFGREVISLVQPLPVGFVEVRCQTSAGCYVDISMLGS